MLPLQGTSIGERKALVSRKLIRLCSAIVAVWMAVAMSVAASPRNLAIEDAEAWREIANPQLSADGHWLAYELKPTSRSGGDVAVVLRSTQDSTEHRFDVGASTPNPGQLRLSNSGKWAAFLKVPNAGRQKDGSSPSMIVLELSSGRSIEVPGVGEFAFENYSSDWLASTGYVQKSAADRTSSLTLRHLPSGRTWHVGDAEAFAFDPKGTYLAWVGPRAGKGGRLHIWDLRSGMQVKLDRNGEVDCGYPSWSPSGGKLAALCGKSDAVLVVVEGLGSGSIRSRRFDPGSWRDFPSDFEISTDRTIASRDVPARDPLVWRGDEHGIFFGIRKRASKIEVAGELKTGDEPEGSPVVWRGHDLRLPRQAEQEEDGDSAYSYLSFLELSGGRFVRLADSTLEQITPHDRAGFLLGYDDRDYRRHTNITGQEYRDYYLVDLRDGNRSVLRKRLRMPASLRLAPAPQLSPDGCSVLYVDGATGDYFAYDTSAGREKRISAGLPVRLYDPQVNQTEVEAWPELQPVQGWTRDGGHVLLTDGYDVWALPLHDGQAFNLTENGRQAQVRYAVTSLDIETEVGSGTVVPLQTSLPVMLDLDEPVYFRTTDFRTMVTGLAVRSPDAQGLHQLARYAADVRYVRAKRASTILVRRQTAVDSPNYYLIDGDWSIGRPLTDTNPQQKHIINWSTGARLLSYTNAKGMPRKAILYLPANYAPGQTYPTIVRIYEGQSRHLHSYAEPKEGGGGFSMDAAFWSSRGYAVLRPDIRPRPDQMKHAILEDVDAAVDAAVASGVADPDRLAVVGHSFGGYEVNVLAAHSSRFKAAISMAGSSDWFQFYAETRGSGEPGSRLVERGSQPYLMRPWWENWDAYRVNSPLFDAPKIRTPLLLVHGRQDEVVRFGHSEQLFNVLRRLDKPVVLLEYPKEGHGLVDPISIKDATLRQLQFLDHFLKGKPAPDWWVAGNRVH